MFGKQVRFATAVYLDDDDSVTSATSDSSYVNSSDSLESNRSDSPEVARRDSKGPSPGGVGICPLDSWIPPRTSQIPRFKGLIGVNLIRFKRKSAVEASDLEMS